MKEVLAMNGVKILGINNFGERRTVIAFSKQQAFVLINLLSREGYKDIRVNFDELDSLY